MDIVIKLEKFNSKIIEVRKLIFEKMDAETCDKFDKKSWFLNAYHNDYIISTIRLSFFPNSPLHDWFKDYNPLPFNKGVVNCTRGSTLKNYRSIGIFGYLFTKSLIILNNMKFVNAIGAYELSGKSKEFTNRIGFREIGNIINFSTPPYKNIEAKFIICDLAKMFHVYYEENKKKLNTLYEYQYNIFDLSDNSTRNICL